MVIEFEGVLRCVNTRGELLFLVSREAAERHVDAGDAYRVGTKRRTRAIVWIGPPVPTAEETARRSRADIRELRRDFGGAKWGAAHNHETETNPANVWTLVSIDAKPLERKRAA